MVRVSEILTLGPGGPEDPVSPSFPDRPYRETGGSLQDDLKMS